jgi:electron transfer flavoprotein alpha subunit
MSDNKGVLVLVETNNGGLASVTAELLGCGRQLADELGEELCAVIVGDGIADRAQPAITLGADKAYTIDNPLLKDYLNETYTQALAQTARQIMPRIILLGQTAAGRDLAPSLAFRLETAAVTDCIQLAIDPDSKQLLQTRPVYGGNALATFTGNGCPQVASLRAKAYPPAQADASRSGEVIAIDVEIDTPKVKLLEKVSQAMEGVKLEDADIVVAGGRGIGSQEGFKQLEELAGLLKGAVGATRPPCDNGWVPASAQIGLTGKIVAPDLYLAVAVSGSSQHTSGCAGARNIVAINKDAEANIFKVARFGIIGDWQKALPAFTDRLKQILA